MKNTIFNLLCALSLLFTAGRAESAQSTYGMIEAHVQDKQGPVAGARVYATNTLTKDTYDCTTHKDGSCLLENMKPGTYDVEVKASRFEKLKRPGIELIAEQRLQLPLDLEPRTLEGKAGYIDSAIVASQVRTRFDAAFHVNAPDRAEFFYARCSCLRGPGPDPVVADLNFQQLYLRAEYAPTKRFSLFTEVPVRWIQPQLVLNGEFFANQAGFSDATIGFKLAAIASSNQYLTFQFQTYFPSGDDSNGLGTNHFSVEPALLYYRRLSDRAALEAQVGDRHPIGGSSCPLPCTSASLPMSNSEGFAGDVFFYGVGPSYVLYRGESVRIAPVIELVGWRVLGGFETHQPKANIDSQEAASADGTNIVNLKIGARTMFGAHSSFYFGYGRALTSAVWYTDIVRVEYRYSF